MNNPYEIANRAMMAQRNFSNDPSMAMMQRQQRPQQIIGDEQRAALANGLRQSGQQMQAPQQMPQNQGINDFARRIGERMGQQGQGQRPEFNPNNMMQMANGITPDMANARQFAPNTQEGVNQMTPNFQNQNMMQQRPQFQQGFNANQFRGIY